jgi:general secretion pathway protein K
MKRFMNQYLANALKLFASHSENGIVLLMTLWAIVVLMGIVMAFSFMTKTEALSTFAYSEAIKRDFLAEAGVGRAIVEIGYSMKNEVNTFADEEELWRADGTVYEGSLGVGVYKVKITDESGKININDDDSIELLKLLLEQFDIDKKQIDEIGDSILDWRDKDDNHHLNGAESDYYKSLEPPYEAQNEDFDTIEELLWVKGMTPEIFYGSEGSAALKDNITIYPKKIKQNRINVKTASKETLIALGMEAKSAEDFVKRRSEGDEVELPAEINKKFVTNKSMGFYTIESVGVTLSGKTPSYGVKATVQINDNQYQYLQWVSHSPIAIGATENEESKN